MNLLSRLGLTPEQVAKMTGAKLQPPKPTPAPRPPRGRQATPAWVWNWLLTLEDGKEFTLADVLAVDGHKPAAAKTALNLAMRSGLAERIALGSGIVKTVWKRTAKQCGVNESFGQAFCSILRLKTGREIDIDSFPDCTRQAVINAIRRSEQAGYLVKAGKRPPTETVYRRTVK